MRSLALPAIVVGLLAAGACDSSPTASSGPPYDGAWSGPLGDGGQISFTVADNVLVVFDATFPQRLCSVPGTGAWLGSQPPIRDGLVVWDLPSVHHLEIRFLAPTRASGTLRYFPPCENAHTWAFTATKQ